jgi:hypothetical protein
MAEFKSLQPAGLAEDFDVESYGAQPIVKEPRSTRDGLEIDFLFPGFMLSDELASGAADIEETFREVGMSNCGWLGESGRPLLPSFGRYVQIPPGHRVEAKARKGKAIRFEQVMVTPAQQQTLDQEGSMPFEFDRNAYTRDELYPADVVTVSAPQEIDGYPAVLIHVRPLQYNAAKRELVGYGNITVSLKFVPQDEVRARPFAARGADRKAFGNLFLNPRRLGAAMATDEAAEPSGPEFLILYAEPFREAAGRLAQWKNLRGLATEARPIADAGATPAALKQYLREQRKRSLGRLGYVLLFGDVDHIAPECVADPGGMESVCTDHYYFTPRDPAGPNEYVLASMAGGRIPVRDAEEAAAVVDQIIRYEREAPADPQYYRRIVAAAYFQDDPPQDGRTDRAYLQTMERIREHLLTLGLEIQRVYVSNNPSPKAYRDGTPVPDEVKAAIVDGATATRILVEAANQGQLIFGHRDHGGPCGWSHPKFESATLPQITSVVPSIFFSINCLTGRYDLPGPSECFAEAILAKNGAAPSLIAATRASGTWRNDSLMKALFDALYPGVIPAFPGSTASYPIQDSRLGDVLNYGMSFLPVAHSGDDGGIKHHTEIYHVIGDPTLQLWISPPRTVTLDMKVTQDRDLLVTLSACPCRAYLSVWLGDMLFKDLHPSGTQVRIPLARAMTLPEWHAWAALPPSRRMVRTCFAAPGYRFVEALTGCP